MAQKDWIKWARIAGRIILAVVKIFKRPPQDTNRR